jgi:hypothetical protein
MVLYELLNDMVVWSVRIGEVIELTNFLAAVVRYSIQLVGIGINTTMNGPA